MEEWSRLFMPLNAAVFTGWEAKNDGTVVFRFGNGYSLVLPPRRRKREADDWHSHWNARDKALEDPSTH